MAALQVFLAVALCAFAQVQGQCSVATEEGLGTISVCTVTSSEIADMTDDCTLTCTADGTTRTLSCAGTTLSSDPADVCPDPCTVPAVTGGDYGTGDGCVSCTEADEVAYDTVCCIECGDDEAANAATITCQDDATFDEDTPTCTACSSVTNCVTCTDTNGDGTVECTGCGDGFAENEAGDTCEACATATGIANCGTCTRDGSDVDCDSCTDGNVLNAAGDACQTCVEATFANCDLCHRDGDDVECDSCDSDMVVNADGTACEACTAAVDDAQCNQCVNNVCTGCEPGYVLEDGTCAACTAAETDEHCTECDTNVCSGCESGYVLNNDAVCEEEDDDSGAETATFSLLAVSMTSLAAWFFA